MISFELYYPVILQTRASGYEKYSKRLKTLADGYSYLCIDDDDYMDKASKEAKLISEYMLNRGFVEFNQRMFSIILDLDFLAAMEEKKIQSFITDLVRPFMIGIDIDTKQLFSIYILINPWDSSKKDKAKAKIEEIVKELKIKNDLLKCIVFVNDKEDFFSAVFAHMMINTRASLRNKITQTGNYEQSGYSVILGKELEKVFHKRVYLYHQSNVLKNQIGESNILRPSVDNIKYQQAFEKNIYDSLIVNQRENNNLKDYLMGFLENLSMKDKSIFQAVPVYKVYLDKTNEDVYESCYQVLLNELTEQIDFSNYIKRTKEVYSICDFEQYYLKTCEAEVEKLENEKQLLLDELNKNKDNFVTDLELFWENFLSKKYQLELIDKLIQTFMLEIKNFLIIKNEMETVKKQKKEEIAKLEKVGDFPTNSLFAEYFNTNMQIFISNWAEDTKMIVESFAKEIEDDLAEFKQNHSTAYLELLKDSIKSAEKSMNQFLGMCRSSLTGSDRKVIEMTGLETCPDDWNYVPGLPSDYIVLYKEEKHESINDIGIYSEEVFEI